MSGSLPPPPIRTGPSAIDPSGWSLLFKAAHDGPPYHIAPISPNVSGCRTRSAGAPFALFSKWRDGTRVGRRERSDWSRQPGVMRCAPLPRAPVDHTIPHPLYHRNSFLHPEMPLVPPLLYHRLWQTFGLFTTGRGHSFTPLYGTGSTFSLGTGGGEGKAANTPVLPTMVGFGHASPQYSHRARSSGRCGRIPMGRRGREG